MKRIGLIFSKNGAADVLTKEVISENSTTWKIMTRSMIDFEPVEFLMNSTINFI